MLQRMDFKIKVDMSVFRDFAAFEEQIPFAISLALNRSGQAAAKELRRKLPREFTIRNKWTHGGITILKAHEKRSGDPRIEIGSVNAYMRPHALGGPRDPGKTPMGAIPVKARKSKGDALNKRADWPMQLIRKGLAYRAGIDGLRKEVKRRKGQPAASKKTLKPGDIVRASRKNGNHAFGDVLWMGRLDADTQIKQDWPMNETIRDIFAVVWSEEAEKAIRFAIRTAKRR